MNHKKTMMMLVIAIGLLVFCPLVTAGDLQPTAAPGPTMKTLDEVEPRMPIPASDTPVGIFIINKSGSYYLEGNRLCYGIGIRTDVNDVTIDLMGYSLIGIGGSGIGVYTVARSNIEIRNGTIRDFGSTGISVGSYGFNHTIRIINVRLISNASNGIYLGAIGGVVKDCVVMYNGNMGIRATTNSVITGNISAKNDNDGISAGSGSVVIDNAVYDNNDIGISAGSGSVIKGNSSMNNATYGIYTGSYCLIDGNASYGNLVNLYTGTGSQVGSNVAP